MLSMFVSFTVGFLGTFVLLLLTHPHAIRSAEEDEEESDYY